ncbi:quinone-dependent dihydroorotate dehydrogenase [Halostreptopolyspora alba]|uniref:Dihydroorotate dehydrogenase (quinone) n=1 Tax=Halostreptopolyspora alba TaxID=2487137 RepID=A0A3N0E705_9ACTN|nr:quinone-dependent dihydroorotate dehydrogenase [Nocardiopsaceae bacterium YIM 96095]
MLYQLLFHTVLRHADAETAHRLSFAALRGLSAVPGASDVMTRLLGPRESELTVRAFGRVLPGPLGLAAGFDKNAEGVTGLTALGFGFVEVGTVTAHPQEGNPRPRMFRLVPDRAIVNRMGFNNDGAAAVAERLFAQRLREERGRARHADGGAPFIGVNIGKTKVVPGAEATKDYVASARELAGFADYLVINVSSPNTPGLRALQAVEELRPLLAEVRSTLDSEGHRTLPLLVKIAPDLADADIDAVADLALDLGLDGIIATNTTIGRGGLRSAPERVAAAGAGGLSGAPLRHRSLEVLRRLRARVGDRLVLVAVGGIETPHDAWERVRAGATLVQGYTGLVYGGPLWPRRMHKGLTRLLRAAGYASVNDAVGTGASDTAGH